MSENEIDDMLGISHAFSNFSACSSDISDELQHLATVPDPALNDSPSSELEPEPCSEFLERETFSTEIIESISLEDLQPTVKLYVDRLQSLSVAVKRSAAPKICLLAKNRADYRRIWRGTGINPAPPLFRPDDPGIRSNSYAQSLPPRNQQNLIINAGAVKSLIYVLKTGTETSKQNAACALLSLAFVDENKLSIGASGAMPRLVVLLIKKDTITTLYKLCYVRLNKERAVSAGARRPLVLSWENWGIRNWISVGLGQGVSGRVQEKLGGNFPL